MSTLAIIPARHGSRRLPGKPLSDPHGKPLIQHVGERARRARCADDVPLATDDERIAGVAPGFGARVAMNSPDCLIGSGRVAEAMPDPTAVDGAAEDAGAVAVDTPPDLERVRGLLAPEGAVLIHPGGG